LLQIPDTDHNIG